DFDPDEEDETQRWGIVRRNVVSPDSDPDDEAAGEEELEAETNHWIRQKRDPAAEAAAEARATVEYYAKREAEREAAMEAEKRGEME
ncbi:hypothetical protein, partial [Xylella fastidiosa]|uniref:hypothetical protein n=1 Tax=Xylella fastidiosa TaxID=2371 RepID=UPI001930F8F6